MKQFYKSWKNKNLLEKKYIKALEKALEWLQAQTFNKDILSVYVKGSFVYREINRSSDIDLVPVMKNEKSLNLVREIRNKHKEQLKPVDILPIAIQELKNNEYFKKPLPGTKGAPDQFTLLLSENRLVYGKPLNTTGFKVRSDRKIYEALRDVIKNRQIEMYERGEFGFRQLGKQFMHLVWWEERLKGRKIDSSWIAMKKACPDNELLQRTIKYRFHPTKDPVLRSKYLADLKEYLEKS